jgi:hypothetical protein
MWGRLEQRRRRRNGRGEALEEALSALKSVRGRNGRPRIRRGKGEKAYGDTVGLGVGILAIVLTLLLLLWLVRKLTSENAPPATEAPEGSIEETPPDKPN